MSAWPTSSLRAPTGPRPASLPGLARRTSRSSLDRVGGRLEVVAIDPSATLLSYLRCAASMGIRLPNVRSGVSFGVVFGSSCSDCGVRGSQPTSTKRPECSGSVAMAVTATACGHGCFASSGSLNTEVSRDHQLLCEDVVVAILALSISAELSGLRQSTGQFDRPIDRRCLIGVDAGTTAPHERRSYRSSIAKSGRGRRCVPTSIQCSPRPARSIR